MPNPILVRKILSLTDARYFAAMGIDWMSMELSEDPLTFSRWHTMREWISGVKLAAELKSHDESQIAKTIIDANPDGIILNTLDFIHLTGGIDLFILTKNLLPPNPELFTQIIPYDPLNIYSDIFLPDLAEFIYLKAEWTADLIRELKNNGYKGGICFEGGEESILGMRDFTEMDMMIEILRS